MVNWRNYLHAREYLDEYLGEVRQLSAISRARYWVYLKHLLLWADEAVLSNAAPIRPSFPAYLASARLDGVAGNLAPATLKKIVQTARRFFRWAKSQYPREYERVSPAWVETLIPPSVTRSAPDRVYVTLAEARQIARLEIPAENVPLRRDQAALALLFASGMRVGALGSLPLCALDVAAREVRQWPSLGVRTKNGVAATTYLLEVPELMRVIAAWDGYMRERLPDDAMWFAILKNHWGVFEPLAARAGANRNIKVGRRMRVLYKAVGLEYKSPHKVRHGHAVEALQRAKDMADYKAVSMNMMHRDIRVTDAIYARLASDEVQRRIRGLTGAVLPTPAPDRDLVRYIHGLSYDQKLAVIQLAASELCR